MKAAELREKNPDELASLLKELHKEQFNLKMQKGTGQLNNPHHMQRVRKEIARVKTILNQINAGS